MTALTENLLNMFLTLGILVHMLDLVTSFSFGGKDQGDDDES